MKNNNGTQNAMLVIGGIFICYSIVGYFFKGTPVADRLKVASSAFSILFSFSKILRVSSLASDKRKRAVRKFSKLLFYTALVVSSLIMFNIQFINDFIHPLYSYLNSGYPMFLSFGITIISMTFQEINESFEQQIKELRK